MKQHANKDKVYEYIVQTHKNTLKQYLELAPRINSKQEINQETPSPLHVQKIHSTPKTNS